MSDTINSTSQLMTKQDTEFIPCPSCGKEIPSFAVSCHACGHKFNHIKVSSSVKLFIKKINKYDKLTANVQKPAKTNWKSWSKGKKAAWDILNIFTFGFPLIIYYVVLIIKYHVRPLLTPDEKRKELLIKTFPLPDDRILITEALVFIKSHLSDLTVLELDTKNAYWARLWYAKAKQIYRHARIKFKDNKTIDIVYSKIHAYKKHIFKRVTAISLVCILVIAIFAGGVFVTSQKFDITDYIHIYGWQTTGMFNEVPEPDAKLIEINANYDDHIKFTAYFFKREQYEEYIDICQQYGYNNVLAETKEAICAKNSNGILLYIFYNESKEKMSVSLQK